MIPLSKKLIPISDSFLERLKSSWFEGKQKEVLHEDFLPVADSWFKSTKLNTLDGWNSFDCIDITMGCTHFIESLIIKYGWDGFQLLPDEYGYYGVMGKFGNEVGQLEPNKPLIVSLPNWKYADMRPEWEEVLKECESKNIDIHIDFAWITTAKNINIDLNHPNIKSFAMSLSKYALQWNRVGLRWSKQRTMDSITLMNKYYGDVNGALISCGAFMIDNIPRDYGWDVYGIQHAELCAKYNLIPTNVVHIVKNPADNLPYSIAETLSK